LSNFVEPPEGYKGVNRWVNWHNYKVELGSGYAPHLLDDLQKRRNNIEAVICMVTGSAGKGKTYFVLRLSEILDKNFDVEVQVPFSVDELMKLISPDSPLKMGQVIVLDESQFAISSRNWASSIQKELMQQLEAIRSKGYIIFIVCLNENVLDVIARNYISTHKIHMMSRGHARAYIYNLSPFSKVPYPKIISRDVKMLLPSAEYCSFPSCLRCPYSGLNKSVWRVRAKWAEKNFPLCLTNRAIYERKKKSFLESMAEESIDNRERKKRINLPDLVKVIREHPDMLKKTQANRIDLASAVVVIRQFYGDNVPDVQVKKAKNEIDLDTEFVMKIPAFLSALGKEKRKSNKNTGKLNFPNQT